MGLQEIWEMAMPTPCWLHPKIAYSRNSWCTIALSAKLLMHLCPNFLLVIMSCQCANVRYVDHPYHRYQNIKPSLLCPAFWFFPVDYDVETNLGEWVLPNDHHERRHSYNFFTMRAAYSHSLISTKDNFSYVSVSDHSSIYL